VQQQQVTNELQQASIQQQKQVIEGLERRLTNLYKSKSWRITAPLRFSLSILKRQPAQ